MIEAFACAAPDFVEWIRATGWVGVGVFTLVFVAATLACVPASPLTAIAGYLFGPLWGTVLMSPMGLLSASMAFVIGRSAARSWLRGWMVQRPRLAAIDVAVGRQGFRIVFLLRLASMPFAPLSYALGASRIRQRDFIVASWLGLLPGTFLYVYLGSLIPGAGQILRGSQAPGEGVGGAFHWFGLVATLVALAVVVLAARGALNQTTNKESNREQTV